MRLRNSLSLLLNVRPGEGRLVLLLLAHFFCIGVARIFTRTAAYTLFLVEFDAQALPYVYIGISLSVTLVSFIILRLAEHLSFSKLLATNLGFLLLFLGAVGYTQSVACGRGRDSWRAGFARLCYPLVCRPHLQLGRKSPA
jgi:ATP/ADP translocase